MGKKIIVVDDSQTIRQQVGVTLRGAGFDVIEAVDGVDGLETIERTDDVALVLCDVNMPRMNGLDLVGAVKAKEKFASLPILMLTTEAQPQMVERARKSGVKGWLVKPFQADMLVSAVKKLTGSN